MRTLLGNSAYNAALKIPVAWKLLQRISSMCIPARMSIGHCWRSCEQDMSDLGVSRRRANSMKTVLFSALLEHISCLYMLL